MQRHFIIIIVVTIKIKHGEDGWKAPSRTCKPVLGAHALTLLPQVGSVSGARCEPPCALGPEGDDPAGPGPP